MMSVMYKWICNATKLEPVRIRSVGRIFKGFRYKIIALVRAITTELEIEFSHFANNAGHV
jgi:hypothetical protein